MFVDGVAEASGFLVSPEAMLVFIKTEEALIGRNKQPLIQFEAPRSLLSKLSTNDPKPITLNSGGEESGFLHLQVSCSRLLLIITLWKLGVQVNYISIVEILCYIL